VVPNFGQPTALLATCFHASFLLGLGLFLDPEDGGDTFLRNVCWYSTDYTALYLQNFAIFFLMNDSSLENIAD
jgi:hypothetical protein